MLRLWPRVAAVALAAAAFLPAAPAGAAPEDDLAVKRAEAERIQHAIAENGRRISILDEQYNQTRLAIDEANNQIAQAQAAVADAEARSTKLKSSLAGRAAEMYVGAGSSQLDIIATDAVMDMAVRSTYSSVAAEHDQLLIDELSAAQEDLGIRRAALERERGAAEEHQAALVAMRDEMDAAQRAQQELLDSVEDDIADLVAEIEAQRQREEEERARRELQARLQAEQAERERAARTSTTTTSRPTAGGTTPTTAPKQSRPAAPTVSAPNANAQIAVDTALAQLGKPYRYAGKGPDYFDCSGLTGFAWKAAGISIPHSSQAQYDGLPHLSMEELMPGDLVFYGRPIHHVGIYIGNDQYVHAPQTGDVVKISSIFRSDYAGAARPG